VGQIDMSPEHMRWVVQCMGVLLLSICVHEFGHAYIADKLGDPLPRSQGRVSLNPIVHADPIGTLAFPLIGMLFTNVPGFGWGRPVQVQPWRFSRRFEMRKGHMFVAFAGPFMNLAFGTLIAILFFTLLATGVLPRDGSHPGIKLLDYAVTLNFILFFFNLIPAPPLDGGAVTEGLLPKKHLPAFQKFSVYGPFILLGMIAIPGLGKVFVWPALFVRDNLYDVLKILFGQ
jgi:Zn-dependent protease